MSWREILGVTHLTESACTHNSHNVQKIPELEITGKCQNAVEALQVIHNHKIDLLLLDIQMPEITGIEMLKTLAHPPKVIFTTAYRDYAVEAFEY